MSFNTIFENENITKISEITVSCDDPNKQNNFSKCESLCMTECIPCCLVGANLDVVQFHICLGRCHLKNF